MVQPNPGAKRVTLDGTELVDILGLEWGTATTQDVADLAGGAGGTAVTGVASGYKLARGEGALSSGTLVAATGLTTIVAAVASIKSAVTPGLSTSVLTVSWTGANLTVSGWKVTASGDATLIATDGTDTVEWIAIGT